MRIRSRMSLHSCIPPVKRGEMSEMMKESILIFARRFSERVPTGFIVTGPNISSQSPLFRQLSSRLRTEINGPAVVLRSSDASNLKAVLKQLIRDSITQSLSRGDENGLRAEQDVCNLEVP
jgi:hypothetical protein